MDYRILWDNNMLLDLFLLRTEENPYILEIEEIFSENKIPIYLSSSQLHNLKYIFGKYLKDNKISIDPNVILKKFIDTHIVKVLKTPSYIDISKWCNNVDIEDELIKLTAETFDLYVLTRDNNFLEILKDRGIHPKNLKEFLKKKWIKLYPCLI
jgi:rRNA-processing protein FCF1